MGLPIKKPPVGTWGPKAAALFFGYGGATWSDGLVPLAKQLVAAGWDARTQTFDSTGAVVAQLAQSNPQRIILCGHSWGGSSAVAAAAALNRPIDLLVLLDGSQPTGGMGGALASQPIQRPISSNVKQTMIWCLPDTPILNRWPCPRVRGGSGVTLDVQTNPTGVNHLTIDNNSEIHATILAAAQAI